jgi:sugar phosphate isomerase/epimerase
VSIWSGTLPDDPGHEAAFDRLAHALRPVLDHAARAGIAIGFEPEPGMFIETCAQFGALYARVPHEALRMTMDVGHVHCLEPGSVAEHVRDWAAWIVNVHIEDMMRGVHEHLPFGQGEMTFLPIVQALREIGYTGGLHVELSRDSHRAVDAVVESYNFLAPLLALASP